MRPKAKAPTRTEAEVLAAVLDAGRVLGIELERQNTGAGINPEGQVVRFGTPGDSDIRGQVTRGPNRGALVHIEVKREGFNPARLRGEKRDHFDRQLARLRRTNEQGGIAFWVDDAVECLAILRHVLAGARVEEPGYGRPTVYYPGAEKAGDI